MNSSPLPMEMNLVHNLCQKELQVLQTNFDRFLQQSEQFQKFLIDKLDGGETKNMFVCIAFDKYMSELTTILNMARKFNMHFQLSEFPDTTFGTISETNSRLLHEYFQWTKYGKQFDLPSQTIAGFPESNVYASNNSPERKAIGSSPIIKPSNNHKSTSCDRNNYENKQNNSTSKRYSECVNAIDIPANHMNDVPLKINLYATTMEEYLRTCLPGKNISHFVEGYTFFAVVTHVRDPYTLNFYICEQKDFQIMLDISCKVDKVLAEGSATLKPFCISQHKRSIDRDNQCVWRAVLIPEKFSQDPNTALLVDFGEIIHLNDESKIYTMPPKYNEIPPMAVKCILKGFCDSKGLLVTDHTKCKTVLMSKEFDVAEFKVLGIESSTLEVILLGVEELQTSNKAERHHKKSETNPFLDAYQLEDETKSDASEPIPLSMSFIYENSPNRNLQKPIGKIGDDLQVTVTYIVSPLNFYGVIEDASKDGSTDLPFWTEMDIEPSQKKLSSSLKTNDIVLARYAKDDYWYRAKIIEVVLDKNLYKVFFIDFGNIENVPFSFVASCNPQQKNMPPQATLFRISGIKYLYDKDHFWSNGDEGNLNLKHATSAVVAMLLNQTVNVKVVEISRRFGNDEIVVKFCDSLYDKIPLMLLEMGVVEEA
ncbi:uncharacterized protein LOC142225628 [Haematobia irritans]|uniref:uncharacterized protein LOC142225628 n=1 Tax=Haematobia irritans TaxID=7368 RepID=UPI003F50BA70